MKKVFTLFASLLLASSGALAQDKWTDLVVNGDMEGEQNPKWSSFWCHDWRRGITDIDPESGQKYDGDDAENGQFQGFAEIVEDPANPANHCAKVIIRSEAEADEAGNKIKADGKLASWDCQFFVYATETIPEGKEIRMTLKVKGEKAGSFETQAHWAPGDYNHYQLFGNVNYTTEWQTIEVNTTVTASQTQESAGKFFQSVAFNLSTMTDGNVVYFDDVKLEVRDPKGPEEFTYWFNFLRKGTLSDDKIGNYTNFTGRDGETGRDVKARVVNDPVDGEPALNVTSIGFNAKNEVKTEVKDDDGNPVLDENGNPTYDITYQDIYIKENGDTLTVQNGGYGIDDWQTQFFVTIPHKLTTGQKIKVVMSARAEKPATIQSQIHGMPGGYIHWQLLGDLNLTEEWQTFEFEDVEITSEMNGGSTIAFNCNVLKEVNNYYFRFDEFSINEGDVTDEDRIVGSENIFMPVAGKEENAYAKIDLTTAVEALGIDDLVAFANDNTMKIRTEEGYSGTLQATAGAFIDETGNYTEKEEGLILALEEDNIDGTTGTFTITNAGLDWAEGKSVFTKVIFVKNGWYYLFNITFVDQQAYEAALGVNSIAAARPAAGAIYDLTGRKVAKAAKGLYIKDGKKFFAK